MHRNKELTLRAKGLLSQAYHSQTGRRAHDCGNGCFNKQEFIVLLDKSFGPLHQWAVLVDIYVSLE